MDDGVDGFLDRLQEQIFDEAREVYGERGFHRWRNPRYQGKMRNPDAHARVTGTCGDTMEICLKFERDRVTDASYRTDGCASSSISGSFAAELTIGRTPDQIADITGETVLAAIGKLPKKDRHCAMLAADTIQEALREYMVGVTGWSNGS